MATPMQAFTRTQYELLPEGFPAQLVEGHLVREPAPTFGHQRIGFTIGERLKQLVGSRRMAVSPVDIAIDEFNVYQPDVVVFREDVADKQRGLDVAVPLLVVEVLSPGTASRDRNVKRLRLLDAGVEEVWLVDPINGAIEVYDRERYRDVPRRVTRGTPIASGVLEGFALTPRELFEVP